MSNNKPWLFPELTPSFKQILLVQMVAMCILLGVILNLYGKLWFAIATALVLLMECVIVQMGIKSAEARQMQERVQEKIMAQQTGAAFALGDGRLLDRSQMTQALPSGPVQGEIVQEPPEAFGH